MPKLITQRKKPNPPTATGRKIVYVEPHSPWQKLVDVQCQKLDFSLRDVASHLGVHHGTFWIWLHNQNGYPHPKSCKPQHLELLSKLLKIPMPTMREALDASRRVYTPKEKPLAPSTIEPLRSLIDILEHDSRVYVKRETVLNLAKRLLRGADPRPEATPDVLKPAKTRKKK